jgi:hypothetical protein
MFHDIGLTHQHSSVDGRFEVDSANVARWSDYPSIAALSINPGIDVMGQSGRRWSSMRRCQGKLRDSTWNVLW